MSTVLVYLLLAAISLISLRDAANSLKTGRVYIPGSRDGYATSDQIAAYSLWTAQRIWVGIFIPAVFIVQPSLWALWGLAFFGLLAGLCGLLNGFIPRYHPDLDALDTDSLRG